MLPVYLFTVEIIATDEMDEAQFHEHIDPSLSHLHSLQGSFDRKQSTLAYYPPSEQLDGCNRWSARGVVLISVGKERAEHLKQLFEAIYHLIGFELPDFDLRAKGEELKFE